MLAIDLDADLGCSLFTCLVDVQRTGHTGHSAEHNRELAVAEVLCDRDVPDRRRGVGGAGLLPADMNRTQPCDEHEAQRYGVRGGGHGP
jgi:hypothetical protein